MLEPRRKGRRVEKEKVVDKIRKLLAKAESTTFEGEADAFLAKAQELMVQHAIDEEEIRRSGNRPTEEIVVRTIQIRQNIPRTKPLRQLLNIIASSFNCRMWYVPGTKNNYVAGFESDTIFVEMLFYSVQMQQHSALLREYEKAKADYEAMGSPFRKTVWRRSFIEGYINRVCVRIWERYKKVDETHGTGTSIVLRNRKSVVDEWVDSQYTIVQAPKERKKAVDWYAVKVGSNAGAAADISGGRNMVESKEKGELS